MEFINFPILGKYRTMRIECIRASAAASRGLTDGNVAHARVDCVGIAMSVTFSVLWDRCCRKNDVHVQSDWRASARLTYRRSRRNIVRGIEGNRTRVAVHARYACTYCLSFLKYVTVDKFAE